MILPFNRNQISGSQYDFLTRGRWGNADIYRFWHKGEEWVIKDFTPCPPLIRNTWGRVMISREFQALKKLRGISGIPEETFLLDEYALCYRYIPGSILKDISPESIGDDFFVHLEKLIKTIHSRLLVHLDVRNQRNILVTESGRPALIDFQSSFNLEKIPLALRQFLKISTCQGFIKIGIRKNREPSTVPEKPILTH